MLRRLGVMPSVNIRLTSAIRQVWLDNNPANSYPNWMQDDALRRAVKAAGGPTKFAAALGINRQAIWQWKKCPINRIVEVEKISGIPREELRPDLYRLMHRAQDPK